jgi:hypothetical protein
MLKDIPNFRVDDVGVAIVPQSENALEGSNDLWNVYLINLKKETIFNVLITTEGYGEIDGEEIKTSVLRHFIEGVEGKTAALIEPIQQEVFRLTNQYWVSFKMNDIVYDRKYVFVKGSISPEFFTHIPILEEHGILIL